MLGSIYIIRNTVNNKVYIGQIVQTLSNRLKQHKTASLNGGKTKLYKAMQEYGADKFYIELIGTYDIRQLTQREIDNIFKFDSIYNGYNSVLPVGDVEHTSKLDDYIEDIINMYLSGSTYNEIALKFNTSRNSVAKICSNLSDIKIETKIRSKHSNTRIVAYNKNYEPIANFNSIKNAGKYLVNNGIKKPERDLRNLYNYINAACQRNNIAYGFRWQYYDDLIYEDKVFRTNFDKEAYIQGKEAYQPEGRQYYVVDGALDNILKKKKKYENRKLIKTLKCKVCNRMITGTSSTGMCNSCANVVAKGKSPKPSREQLLIDVQTMNKQQIAIKYGRTKSTVSYWFKQYKI